MATFHAKMLEYKRNKQTCRNRGESIGDHRGTLQTRPAIDRDMDDLERAIAKLVQWTFIDPFHAFAQDLHFAVLELNDATVTEIPL